MRTRFSSPADLEQLIELARQHAAEQMPPAAFSEDVAAYTFNGALRCDPVVIVLLDEDDVVGFVLGSLRRALFNDTRVMHEEARFIRADKRSLEAESLLLHALRGFAERSLSSETRVMVPGGGEAAVPLFNFVEFMGFGPAGVQMRIEHAAAPPVDASVH